jgi:hypothetical protein
MLTYDPIAIQRAAFLTPGPKGRWGLNMNWIGDIGSAKTAMIEQLCQDLGLQCEAVLLGLREPADLLGYGVPQDDGYMRYHASDFVKRANDADGAVIYLDEFNYAAPSVQGAAQRMILEGIVGEAELEPGVRFVLSMNPIEQAMGAGGGDLSIALANRMGHLKWIDPTVEQWGAWMLGDGEDLSESGDIIALEKDTLARWSKPWAMARASVVTFLRSKPGLLKAVPKPNTPAASGPFPTPRSWESATRALASGNVHGLDEESRWAFMGAFVGDEPVSEFISWQEANDLPDPEDVLDGKVEFKHDPKRLDVTMAVLAACAAMVVPEDAPKRDDRAVAFWEIIAETADSAPDIAIAPVRAMCKAKGRLGKVSKTARKVMASMHPVLQVARMVS